MSHVPVLPTRLDWSSVIGLFILNFGSLDVALMDVLKRRQPPERWNALTKDSFHERVVRLRKMTGELPEMVDQQSRWLLLIKRLEALRDLRNHLAHSVLSITLADDALKCSQVLCLTKDVSNYNADAKEVTFDELFHQTRVLMDLTDELLDLGGE